MESIQASVSGRKIYGQKVCQKRKICLLDVRVADASDRFAEMEAAKTNIETAASVFIVEAAP